MFPKKEVQRNAINNLGDLPLLLGQAPLSLTLKRSHKRRRPPEGRNQRLFDTLGTGLSVCNGFAHTFAQALPLGPSRAL